ncbi:retrovirus-related pol polyprotein from transposon TNT 1-94 [Tanacetum coccineum]|uniref:Retrovirus-related pol polyprotein from transposon TNT 1-94 n=1 Tax=Tanacetum coccineum TaxID=301880 RepID=A0ABQ5CVN2_9ASTR
MLYLMKHQVEMEDKQSTLETTQPESGDYDRSNNSTPEKSKSAPPSEVCSPNEASSSSKTTQLRRSERGQVPRCRFPIKGEETSSLVMFDGDSISVNEAMVKEEWRVTMLVVRAFTQQQRIDYEETFSPVARFEIVQIILAVVAQEQGKIHQFDVKSAFLNEELKEEVYVTQPPGSSLQLIQEFQTTMKKMFDMTDLGELQYFLGLEITQTQEGIFMSQKKYVADTLKKFNMQGCKISSTPMNTNEKLRFEDDTGAADASVYRSLVGRLIYLTHARPDISYAVGVLSRFMHRPTKHHFGAMKRVLHYLVGTQDYGIWFSKTKDFRLKGTDSDWAGSVDDMRSTSGNCFTLGTAAISWSSKKQASVALSSTEAEYVAAAAASCQAIWLRRILKDVGHEQVKPAIIKCDNKSTVLLARNPIYHGRTKHIEIKHHYIRELIANREIQLEECRSDKESTSSYQSQYS